jgi:cell division protein FtsI/penicillin-binding protein 2
MEIQLGKRPTWRDYQTRLKRKNDLRNLLYRLRWGAIAAFGLVVIALISRANFQPGAAPSEDKAIQPRSSQTEAEPDTTIGKRGIRRWLTPESIVNLKEKSFDIQVDQKHFQVDTSLDLTLQTSVLEKMHRSKTELMGLVALDPDDGRVLAMVGIDADKAENNPCLDNEFPAASIFKIVTAAAAIEQHNYTPETKLTFNGGKYTLYKSQLKDTVNRYTNTISFQDSFAQSVNPVFGKIGAKVGRTSLETYGTAFGFNREIDFDVAFPSSLLDITDESYHLAEIGCGFNRTTTMTPLHGALIAAAVLNGGRLPEPTMIEQIVDETGREIYRRSSAATGSAVSSSTSSILENMMARTVTSGTCRKTFRNAGTDRVLSRLVIGGKTGSINNRQHTRRMDWFIGFAREKNGTEKIAVAVVVGHGEYIGTKASEFARYTFRNYFKEYFASTDNENSQSG